MFELNKEHRQALLIRLQEVNEKLELTSKGMATAKEKNPDLVSSYEIDEFLLTQQKKTIEEALIENEIDY